MKIIKVLNNSLVLAAGQNGEEIIVMGKGIGFNGKVGEVLQEDKIEKVFVVKNEEKAKEYMALIEGSSKECVEIAQAILQKAEEHMNTQFNEQLFMMLVDHISFAVTRYKEGIIIQNRLLSQVKKFYPKEFEIGKDAVKLINEKLDVNLPEEEAGNIAFHLVNAKSDEKSMENTLLTVKLMKDIVAIIQYHFSMIIDEESLSYSRFITHLQFFIQRLLEGKMMGEKDDFILQQVMMKYPKEYECALLIKEYVKGQMGKVIESDELLYLTIHITRITESSK